MSFLIYPREDGITSGSIKPGDNRGRRQRYGNRDSRGQKNAAPLDEMPAQPRGNRNNTRNTGQAGNKRSGNNSSNNNNRDSRQRKPKGNIPGNFPALGGRFERESSRKRGALYERLKWTPPELSKEPMPMPECPWCSKPIKDIANAITERESGMAIHFDCVLARLAQGEILGKGEAVCYIGGGRFGVVQFGNPQDPKKFTIKKIFEWENKDIRAEWRGAVSDHYSIT